mmetsp:Transcript_42079/g.61859  ORF Transcript_42079/g.61859 Transcript_42079/m.61859 type:complete len:208 (-) Transcript_42079:441-1064(-)
MCINSECTSETRGKHKYATSSCRDKHMTPAHSANVLTANPDCAGVRSVDLLRTPSQRAHILKPHHKLKVMCVVELTSVCALRSLKPPVIAATSSSTTAMNENDAETREVCSAAEESASKAPISAGATLGATWREINDNPKKKAAARGTGHNMARYFPAATPTQKHHTMPVECESSSNPSTRVASGSAIEPATEQAVSDTGDLHHTIW